MPTKTANKRKPKIKEKPALAELAKQIIASHDKTRNAEWESFASALRTGNLLKQAKAQLKHGKWKGWVLKNCKFAIREAQRYLRIAKYASKLKEFQAEKKLSLREALALLGKKEKDEAGAVPLLVTLTDLEEAMSRDKPTWTANDLEHKFVEAKADQFIRGFIRLAGKRAKGKDGPSPAITITAFIGALKDALTLDRVMSIVSPVPKPDPQPNKKSKVATRDVGQ